MAPIVAGAGLAMAFRTSSVPTRPVASAVIAPTKATMKGGYRSDTKAPKTAPTRRRAAYGAIVALIMVRYLHGLGAGKGSGGPPGQAVLRSMRDGRRRGRGSGVTAEGALWQSIRRRVRSRAHGTAMTGRMTRSTPSQGMAAWLTRLADLPRDPGRCEAESHGRVRVSSDTAPDGGPPGGRARRQTEAVSVSSR